MRAPIPYYGGKGYMYKKIIDLFPPHQTYVEPFGGAAWVLLNKPPSPVEIYNDLDGDVVNLFRVLRDRGDELIEKLKLTPYAREEFVACLDNRCEDPVERARRTFVRFRQGFNGRGGKSIGNWHYSIKLSRQGTAKAVSEWLSMIFQDLSEITERFRSIQIENSDALVLIPRYDTPSTLFYCDPPYVGETRKSNNVYSHELPEEEHHKLLKILGNIQGMALLSGYQNALYKTLTNWEVLQFEVPTHSSSTSRTRDGKGGKAPRRTEVIWLNPAAMEQRGKHVRNFWIGA